MQKFVVLNNKYNSISASFSDDRQKPAKPFLNDIFNDVGLSYIFG